MTDTASGKEYPYEFRATHHLIRVLVSYRTNIAGKREFYVRLESINYSDGWEITPYDEVYLGETTWG
ncbi:hypothetical protein FK482_0103 [Listeria phage LP-013]|uniref:Uncharacterized protein n=1 Tax=Listeria phage LP-013 TaxID=2590047 RepID=A0A514U745_9CAUD|nr:hypothetical protein FK482_0103 [Listeria phage LP-013]